MLISYKNARKGLTVSLCRVRLNKGGYEIGNGQYYGQGAALYRLYIAATVEDPGSPCPRYIEDCRDIRASARECAEALAVPHLEAFKNAI